MFKYVLDTDTLSHLRQGNEAVLNRISNVYPGSVAITIITVEEQLSGWYALLRRSQSDEALERAYAQLAHSTRALAKLPVLDFSLPAIQRFRMLEKQKLGVGKMDLRIGAIALESNLIVVTRNIQDYSRIPLLQIENWVDV
jgi:tRNA(fMet)-specific endonuclease VapC